MFKFVSKSTKIFRNNTQCEVSKKRRLLSSTVHETVFISHIEEMKIQVSYVTLISVQFDLNLNLNLN